MMTWPGSILNRPLPVQSVSNLSMECWPLCDCQHFIINGDSVPFFDEDVTDGTGFRCADLGFHFHGFQNDQHVTFFDGVAGTNENLPDVSTQGCVDRLATPCGCGCRRGCRSRSCSTLVLDLADLTTFTHRHHVLLAVHL